MNMYTLSIGAHVYSLDPDADIDGFQTRMTEVVQRGGGMIDIPTRGSDRISALASPGLAIVFQTRDLPDDEAPADQSEAPDMTYPDEFDWEGS